MFDCSPCILNTVQETDENIAKQSCVETGDVCSSVNLKKTAYNELTPVSSFNSLRMKNGNSHLIRPMCLSMLIILILF